MDALENRMDSGLTELYANFLVMQQLTVIEKLMSAMAQDKDSPASPSTSSEVADSSSSRIYHTFHVSPKSMIGGSLAN